MARARREARVGTHELERWEELPAEEPGQTCYRAKCYKCKAYALVTVTEGRPGVRRQIVIAHHGTDELFIHRWLSGW